MKKLIALVLALVCALGLVACYASDTDNTDPQTETVSNTSTEETTLLHETESEDSNIEITDLTVRIDNSFSVSESVVVCEIAADGEFATIYSDLQSIYSVAANVAVGTVTEIQYTDDTAIPRTVYSFHVSETLKGTIQPNSLISISESNGYVRVSTFIEVYGQAIFDELYDGGVFGGFTDMQVTDGVILQSLYGAPLAEVGDQYILFLGKQKTEGRIKGTYVPMGNFMGKYVLDTNTNLYIRFFPLENPYFYAIEDSSTGNILIEQPMSLSDIKDSIAGVD